MALNKHILDTYRSILGATLRCGPFPRYLALCFAYIAIVFKLGYASLSTPWFCRQMAPVAAVLFDQSFPSRLAPVL